MYVDPDQTARRLEVIDNPFDLARLDPARIDRNAARARPALPGDAAVLALVGQIPRGRVSEKRSARWPGCAAQILPRSCSS